MASETDGAGETVKFAIKHIEVEIGFSRAGLVSLFNKNWNMHSQRWAAMHFFVRPCMSTYYKYKGSKEIEVDAYWVWGRATEQYDHNGEYFGLGPLFLLCW